IELRVYLPIASLQRQFAAYLGTPTRARGYPPLEGDHALIVEVAPGLAICHGSPLDEDTYVFSDIDAFEIFSAFDTPVTFFGHTHIPSLFSLEGRRLGVTALRGAGGTIHLDPAGRYLINPGSIGQPRDRDPRASYMTYDSHRRLVRWYRLPYPILAAQKRILKAGLPQALADRLAIGA
ncbi:MAG TPA: hypothetical protein VN999_15780, partial [Thermoanaerobaculia bacterium]|nr:hypothetical protein [Thermoanaerobaculia bacterium]